jgi:hypothetical protein
MAIAPGDGISKAQAKAATAAARAAANKKAAKAKVAVKKKSVPKHQQKHTTNALLTLLNLAVNQ